MPHMFGVFSVKQITTNRKPIEIQIHLSAVSSEKTFW